MRGFIFFTSIILAFELYMIKRNKKLFFVQLFFNSEKKILKELH